MRTKKLSDDIRHKIDGWELIGEKYAGKDFNLGDETILNLFYDRTNARLNILFSLNYGEPDCDEFYIRLFNNIGVAPQHVSCRVQLTAFRN